MPRHWWVPVQPSNPGDRKKDVRREVDAKKGRGSLRSFWKADDGNLYAIVRADALEPGLLQDIKAVGEPLGMEDVPG